MSIDKFWKHSYSILPCKFQSNLVQIVYSRVYKLNATPHLTKVIKMQKLWWLQLSAEAQNSRSTWTRSDLVQMNTIHYTAILIYCPADLNKFLRKFINVHKWVQNVWVYWSKQLFYKFNDFFRRGEGYEVTALRKYIYISLTKKVAGEFIPTVIEVIFIICIRLTESRCHRKS
jgi:hypothetical protein